MMGIANRNENLEAVSRVMPRNRPAVMVTPERGGAGDQGHGLGNADEEGVFPVQFIEGALAFGQPVGKAEEQAEEQGGEEDNFHRPQFVVDHIQQRQAGQSCRDGADDEVPGQGALADDFALANGNQSVPGDAKDIPPEIEHNRQ